MSKELWGCGSVYKQTKLVKGVRTPVANWSISFYVNGKQIRESAGSPDRAVAEKLLKRRLAQTEGGKPFIAPKAEKLRLREMLDELKTDYQHKENRSDISKRCEYLLEFFGADARALSITPDRIKAYVAKRKRDVLRRHGVAQPTSNGTINRDLAALQRAFALAIENRKLSHDHAPGRMPLLPEAEPRQGFLERRDFERLRERLPEYLKLPIAFLYATGWRKGAMQSRQWHDAELERDADGVTIGGTLHLARKDSKNKQPYFLPITGELLEIIRTADAKRADGCPYIFHRDGAPIGDFSRAWRTACRELDAERKAKGQAPLLVHDLRRSRIRHLIRSGVSQTVAMRISGHKTTATFARYNITSAEDLEHALNLSQAYDAAKARAPERPPAQILKLSERRARRSA